MSTVKIEFRQKNSSTQREFDLERGLLWGSHLEPQSQPLVRRHILLGCNWNSTQSANGCSLKSNINQSMETLD